MADFPTQARVVIIGGGAVGASCLYHLAKAGWTDCVLLEKNELTAGSTWHAAGNVPTFSTGWAVMNMQRYSTELYRGLAEEVDYPMNYHVTGSLRLSHGRERTMEFERACGMGRYQGIDMAMLTPDQAVEMYPFLETHDLHSVLYDPTDGDIDPAQLTQALAKGARSLGARIERFCPATGVTQKPDGSWIVHTEKGDIACEYVVNAAGYYAQQVGEWFKPYGGRTVPMMTMSHQYVLTEQVAEIEAYAKEKGGKLPLLRDVDVSYYLRQEKNGFNIGPYEPNCKGHWMTPDDQMPDDFSFQLYPDDLDRIMDIVADAMERVPLSGSAGVERIINGPIPYTPDGNPLIGPMPGVKNAFEACVFTFGIAQGGGAGKILAEWVTEGQTEWDCWSLDPRRFTDYTDQAYCDAKGMEVYGHEYAMHFPHHEWPAGRDKKLSPLHSRLKDAGAVFGVYNGWERANYYAKPGDDTSEEATQTWDRNGPWEARIKEECEAVRDHCGVLPITGFTRIKVEGPGAKDWVDSLTASRLPSPGRVGLIYFADARGRIVTEMSCMVHSDTEVGLITAAAAQWHDAEFLWRQAPEGISVTDHTKEVECLLVTGPKSREILVGISEGHDLSKGWLTSSMEGTVAGQSCALLRVSFAGELGWEIHCDPAGAPAIWDALLDAGVKPFGMWALDRLRLEKGYRAWKGDLSTDYSLLEGGLDRFIRFEKPDFPGKAALENERQQGMKKRFTTLVVEAGDQDPPYMSTVWQNGDVVGEVTSGGWGYRVNKCVALAMVRSDLAVEGTGLEVEIFGERFAATVQADQPMWDPQNERLRA